MNEQHRAPSFYRFLAQCEYDFLSLVANFFTNMIVPLEVLELILLKCDGKTLLDAKNASEGLSDTIDYLGKVQFNKPYNKKAFMFVTPLQKTRLWEWCCKEEIPAEQLVEYLPLYSSHSKDRWEQIYLHWSSWEYFTPRIAEPVLCPNNSFKRISTIAVSSRPNNDGFIG